MERSIFLKRQQELGYLNDLNTNFQNYMAHVRNLQEQDSRIESTNIANMTKALEDEIVHLKNMYENELHAQRAQLEECGREKNQHQLTASQNATKVADLEEK